MGYALGKIQRVLKNMQLDEPIYAHGAVYTINERLRAAGFELPPLLLITKETDRKNRRAIDQGFVLSDHIDWDQLNQTVIDTGAEKVYVTHGFTSVFAKWLNEKGIDAAEVKTMYGDEKDEVLEGGETENTATS